MTCAECRERLAEADAEVVLHLEACADCRRERARHERLMGLLEAFPAAESAARPPRVRRLPLILGMAAGVLLAFGLARRDPQAGELAGHRLTALPGTVWERRGPAEAELRRGVLHVRGSGGGLTIRTPAARVEVIGTEFWMEVEDDMNRVGRIGTGAVLGIVVTAGAVRVSNAHGELRVGAGQRATASASTAPAAAADLGTLRAERDALARRLEEKPAPDPRVEALRKRLAELEGGAGAKPTPESKAAAARDIFEAFVRAAKKQDEGAGDTEAMVALLGRLGELDESVAGVLIGLYREQTESPGREVALILALRCGGAAPADLLSEWLDTDLVSARDRRRTMEIFGSQMESMFIRKLEVSDRLRASAERYLTSTVAGERAGAVGILGWKDDPSSRAALQRTLEQDTEESVRASALRGLGRIGDRATLQWLRTVSARPGETLQVPPALTAAIQTLEARFPEGK